MNEPPVVITAGRSLTKTQTRGNDSPPSRFSEKDYEQLRYLGDHGLIFVSTHLSETINFGVRLEKAKGQLPFVCPAINGDYYGALGDIDYEDRRALVDAQQWSVLEAYRLGFRDGVKRER